MYCDVQFTADSLGEQMKISNLTTKVMQVFSGEYIGESNIQKPLNIIASLQTFPRFVALLHPSYMSFKNAALCYAFANCG